MRILVADDQTEIRALVSRQLELSGHRVVTVANGQQALKAFENEPFHAVLLDEQMPVLTGVQAARAIRERERRLATRVVLIALTGNNTEQDVKRLLAEGFDAVLGKPFSIASLDSVLSRQAATSQPAQFSPEPLAESGNPVAYLLDRVGGDSKLARQMIRAFLRDTPKRMAAIESALRRKDWQAVASLAHAIKGSVGLFDASAARDHAQELQDLASRGDRPAAARIVSFLAEDIEELQANLRVYAETKGSRHPGTTR